MTTAFDGSLKRFGASFGGTLVLPGDPGYDKARSVWNGEIDRRPAVIARCASPEQVAAALAFGREQGLEISVRGGGHNYSGAAVAEGGLMVDLSPMRAVSVDVGLRRARCGGGATWADLDVATQAHGLAVTGGIVSHTGVGGLTLGGGFGYLTRKAGLTCDNLVSAEVVTVSGEVLTASTEQNTDLFWALRGGGGNFGVVTSFEFALHEVNPVVHVGIFFWGATDGVPVLRSIRELLARLPDDIGVLVEAGSVPEVPFVPAEHQGAPGIGLVLVSFDSAEQLEGVAGELRSGFPLLFDVTTPVPYVELQKMGDAAQAWGCFAYEKGLYLNELSDEALEVIVTHLTGERSTHARIALFPLGAAYRQVRDQDTAFGGSRSAAFMVSIEAACPTREILMADRAWVRACWDDLVRHSASVGSYVNFMAEFEEDRVRASYGTQKHERLARIKARYDPENILHLNANIKPLLPTG
jgi:FAD/FMN-containing dehydrogenase